MEHIDVQCKFCQQSLPLEAAMDAGWIPGYYEYPADHAYDDSPVCEDCCSVHLYFDQYDFVQREKGKCYA